MATTYGLATNVSKEDDYDMSLWYDSKFYKIGLITMLSVAIFWIWYQRRCLVMNSLLLFSVNGCY